jgi:hypothetical protein
MTAPALRASLSPGAQELRMPEVSGTVTSSKCKMLLLASLQTRFPGVASWLQRTIPRKDVHQLVQLRPLIPRPTAPEGFAQTRVHVIGQDDFADFTQRRPHGSHLEQHIDAVAILGEHAQKAGNLAGNSLQSCLGVAAGSFIHVARRLHAVCRCNAFGHDSAS